jgi:hypothetical protein
MCLRKRGSDDPSACPGFIEYLSCRVLNRGSRLSLNPEIRFKS